MIKKMYSVKRPGYNGFSSKIKELEVIRETETNIWIEKFGREKKNNTYERHFDTWSEAYAYLLGAAEGVTNKLRDNLKSSEEKLYKIRNMAAP